MQFLEWKDSYNIGIREIDIQHRGLFDIISKLSASRRFETEGKYFFAMFHQFIEFTKIHFSTEERYMRDALYPGLLEHQQEHVQFLEKITHLFETYDSLKPKDQQKILDQLKEWYMNHILGTDRDYQKTLLDKGYK